jgi:hypothetical protein
MSAPIGRFCGGSPFQVLQVFLAGPLRTGGKPETLRPGSVFSVTRISLRLVAAVS